MTPTIASLKTKVKNLTAAALYVFFIPPFGKTLTANEEVDLPWPGGLDTILTSGRFGSQRRIGEQIERMIVAKKIAIIEPPQQIKDVTTGLVRDLVVTSGTLSAPASSLEALPSPPTSLAAGTPLTTSVPLTWVIPTDVGTRPLTSFTIEYKLNSEPTTWSTQAVGSPSATGASVTGLTTGLAYNFRIKANSIVGASAISNVVNATTA